MTRFLEYLGLYLLIIFFQVLLFDNIQISGYLNIIIYPLFLVLLPFNVSNLISLLVGALLGFTADVLNSSSGVYSIVFILLGYLRPFLLKIFTKSDYIDTPSMPLSGVMGVWVFFRYLFVMMFLMFVVVTFLERLTLEFMWVAMIKIVISSVVSTIVVYFIQLPLNKLNKNVWV